MRVNTAYGNIHIDSHENAPNDFVEHVNKAIEQIASKEIGNALLSKIAESKHSIIIVYGKQNRSVALDRDNIMRRNKGSPSLIEFNLEGFSFFANGKPSHTRIFELAHQLIHAYHNSKGIAASEEPYCFSKPTTQEEENTLGMLGIGINLAAIHAEHGYDPDKLDKYLKASEIQIMSSLGQERTLPESLDSNRHKRKDDKACSCSRYSGIYKPHTISHKIDDKITQWIRQRHKVRRTKNI